MSKPCDREMPNEMTQENLPPPWIEAAVDAGIKAGQAVLACEALLGQEVIYAEKSLLSLATLERARCLGGQVELRVRLRTWNGVDSTQTGTLRYPLASLRLGDGSLGMDAGYGVYSTLTFHPALIAHVIQLARVPGWQRTAARLVRDADDWPLALATAVRQSTGLPLLSAAVVPRCQVQHAPQRFVVELRGIPVAEGACLIWSVDHPLEAVPAVCQVCRPLSTDLMQHLLRCDRTHRAAHPNAMPTVGADADELFAHRPELAMLYHQRFAGVSLNGNLDNHAAIRLLADVGRHCGFEMAEPMSLECNHGASDDGGQNLSASVGPASDGQSVELRRRLTT